MGRSFVKKALSGGTMADLRMLEGTPLVPALRRANIAFILDEDPDLGERLPPDLQSALRRRLWAQVIRTEPSRWEPPVLDDVAYGFLLLDGLIARRIRIGAAVSTELLAPGDILRPWEKPCDALMITPTCEWRILKPARLAVLDARVTRLVGQVPELHLAFSDRLLRRARYGEYLAALSHLKRVDQKLCAVLWYLASLWGRVTPAGLVIPFRLTHQVLAEIVGAQRPSVTLAMRKLQENGTVELRRGGYLLAGAPAEWSEIRPSRRA